MRLTIVQFWLLSAFCRERRRSSIGMFLPSNRIFLSAKYLKPCRQLPQAIPSLLKARSCHKTLREQEFSCRFHRHQPRRPGSDARSQATSALGSVAGSSGRLQQSILSISRPTTRRLKRRRTPFFVMMAVSKRADQLRLPSMRGSEDLRAGPGGY